MKHGWEVKKLGDIATIKGGKRVPKGYRLESTPTNYPYIRVTDFNDHGSVDLNNIHYVNAEVFQQIKNYTISINDLYISIAGTIGKTGIIPKELDGANLTENACKLVFKDDIEPKFIYYFTKTEDFLRQTGLNTRVAAMPKLAIARLSTIQLLCPNLLSEQQRIVTILDEAFEAINQAKENAEQNLKNAKELFESYLQSVFETKGEDWKEKKLGEVCEIDPKKLEIKGIPSESLVSFLPMKDLGFLQKEIIAKEVKKLSEVFGNYTYFAENDILLAKVTPCFENGKLGIARNLKNGIGFGSSEYIVFRPLRNIITGYIFYLLSSKLFRNDGKKQMFGACGLKRLSKDYVKNFLFYLPPLTKQQAIVAKLDALSEQTKKLERLYEQKLADLEELKKSILQKAFNGEL